MFPLLPPLYSTLFSFRHPFSYQDSFGTKIFFWKKNMERDYSYKDTTRSQIDRILNVLQLQFLGFHSTAIKQQKVCKIDTYRLGTMRERLQLIADALSLSLLPGDFSCLNSSEQNWRPIQSWSTRPPQTHQFTTPLIKKTGVSLPRPGAAGETPQICPLCHLWPHCPGQLFL